MPPASDLNGGSRTESRQIGAGVIIAHAVISICVTVLAGLGTVGGFTAVVVFLGAFAAVFMGDLFIQVQDMEPVAGSDDSDGKDSRPVVPDGEG